MKLEKPRQGWILLDRIRIGGDVDPQHIIASESLYIPMGLGRIIVAEFRLIIAEGGNSGEVIPEDSPEHFQVAAPSRKRQGTVGRDGAFHFPLGQKPIHLAPPAPPVLPRRPSSPLPN